MVNEYTVKIEKIIKELSLEVINMPSNQAGVTVVSRNVSRPSIELTGFFEEYDNRRLLIMGNTEYAYLNTLSGQECSKAVNDLIKRKPPAIIICRGLEVKKEILEAAKKHDVILLRAHDSTSSTLSDCVTLINAELAPRITRHGVLMEIYGQGSLIVGDSGVGKSETAIELIKRGHRLIADDAVEIRKISKNTLMGSSPENIRHFIELRGIGIINASRIFGMGAVKLSGKLDMVINLENWDRTKIYDRMGLDEETTNILGIEIPIMTIPVKPGRNLAVIIEVAAMNNRQKAMGYNAAQELLQNLGMDYDDSSPKVATKPDWSV